MDNLTEEASFLKDSIVIAKGFLQTVVAVDDELGFHKRAELQPKPLTLATPIDDGTGSTEERSEDTKMQNNSIIAHPLDYQTLSQSFAKLNLVCSGLKPESDENISDVVEYIVKSTKNADLSILDWEMQPGTKGVIACNVIENLLSSDINEGGRLRLICIYTGVDKKSVRGDVIDDILALADKIENVTAKYKKKNSIQFFINGQKECLWQVCVVSKDITEEILPEILIEKFARLAAGLLSNASLAAIGDIRRNTHHLLSKFNKSLDPAYVSHVLGLISLPDSRPRAHEVAIDYAVNLISEEIKSNLQVSVNVKNSLDSKVLGRWPKYVNPKLRDDYFRIELKESNIKKIGNSYVENLLLVKDEDEFKKIIEGIFQSSKDSKIEDTLNRFEMEPISFSEDSPSKEHLYALCALEVVRRDRTSSLDNHLPSLKQGTILKRICSQQFYICVKPLCDTVRLQGKHNFTLLEIEETSSGFTHVIAKDKTSYYRFNITPSSKSLHNYYFKADEERREIIPIMSTDKNLIYSSFNAVDSDAIFADFEWIGEFKEGISQAIVNDLAASMSRVGIDTFEWLRIKNRK